MSAAPILSRESRWLRLGGMGLMAVSLSGIAFLEGTDLRQLIRSGDRSNLTQIALVFVLSANLFGLGLVLLLAGLRQLSLRRSVHARRGALGEWAPST